MTLRRRGSDGCRATDAVRFPLLPRLLIVTAICAAGCLEAAAQVTDKDRLPALKEPVNDFATVIDAASAAELDRMIRALQSATGDAVVVVTVPTFQPYGDIQEYAEDLFENKGQGIGEKGKDNGLLVLVATQDRKVWIEVGYGLEGIITDGYAGETSRQYIVPAFREGRYGEGLKAGVARLINRIAEERGVTLDNVPTVRAPSREQRRVTGGIPPILFVILALIIIQALANRGSRKRQTRYWRRGPWSGWEGGVGPFGGPFGGWGGGGGGFSGGGGFGGFGGGRSGGGGGGAGW
jgi:uncharacterized protein